MMMKTFFSKLKIKNHHHHHHHHHHCIFKKIIIIIIVFSKNHHPPYFFLLKYTLTIISIKTNTIILTIANMLLLLPFLFSILESANR